MLSVKLCIHTRRRALTYNPPARLVLVVPCGKGSLLCPKDSGSGRAAPDLHSRRVVDELYLGKLAITLN